MIKSFANMSRAEAYRFMEGKDNHPIRDVTASIIGNNFVVDLGCGRGIRIKELYDKEQYLGVDCAMELVKLAYRDNPGYSFICSEISEFLDHCDDSEFPAMLISSVLEHVDSLEIAQEIYFKAAKKCDLLVVGWNHPPHYPATEIIKVKAELDGPMNQNHYQRGSFESPDLQVKRQPVESAEVWTVRHR